MVMSHIEADLWPSFPLRRIQRAVILAALLAAAVWGLRIERQAALASAEERTAALRAALALSPRQPTGTASLAARRPKGAAEFASERSLPWPQTLTALELAVQPGVSLKAVETSVEDRLIRIEVEARDLGELNLYIERLNAALQRALGARGRFGVVRLRQEDAEGSVSALLAVHMR